MTEKKHALGVLYFIIHVISAVSLQVLKFANQSNKKLKYVLVKKLVIVASFYNYCREKVVLGVENKRLLAKLDDQIR